MDIVTGVAIEGGTLYLLAQIRGGGGVLVESADVTSVEIERWKVNPPASRQLNGWQTKAVVTATPSKFGDTLTPDVADVVFDALQTDVRWTLGGGGYNFAFPLGPDDFDVIALADYPKSQWYRLDVLFTPAAPGATPFIASFLIELQSSLFGKS